MRELLHRYWFEFEEGERDDSAFGVTAFSREDALAILQAEVFEGGSLPLIVRECRRAAAAVRVRTPSLA